MLSAQLLCVGQLLSTRGFERLKLVVELPSSSLPCCCAHPLQLAVRCKVEALSFSAHADYEQTSSFLDTLQPPHVVLVHGERGEMMKLRAVSQHRPAREQLWRAACLLIFRHHPVYSALALDLWLQVGASTHMMIWTNLSMFYRSRPAGADCAVFCLVFCMCVVLGRLWSVQQNATTGSALCTPLRCAGTP